MKQLKIVFISTFIIFLNLSSLSYADLHKAIDYYHPVEPESVHSRLSFMISKRLEYQHYTSLKLDDNLASTVFDAYLKALDPQHSIFLKGDINQFNYFRGYLDDAYKRGQLDPAFLIFNTYQQRTAERVVYMLNQVENSFNKINLDTTQTLEIDREKTDWLASKSDIEKLWRKQLKNQIISMRLNDKKDKEIIETLTKRFKVQLNRLKQTKSEDAFRIYVNALAESYDPHTQYFSPRVSENFNIQMRLSLEGIGAMLQEDDGFTKIKRLVPGGPAHQAGQLKAGDRIVAVAQGSDQLVDVVGWRLDDVVQLIRGKKDTIVRLRIIPHKSTNDSDTRVIEIVRNTVKLEEQSAQKEVLELDRGSKKYKIGIIDLPTFYIDFKGAQNNEKNYRSTTRDVKKLLVELKKENIDGLILDLRNNGGGSLKEVSTLLSLFIESGPSVQIKTTESEISSLSDEKFDAVYDSPLVVLVNRLSASASEIFAGAIQDYQRGIIVGNQTFGKGTVQALQPLTHGQLKITHAKFYRVSGDSTQNLGVIPDLQFPAIYDREEIGESSLPEALKWDQINAADYVSYTPINKLFPQLKVKHNKRVSSNPDFIYLNESLKRIEKLRDKTLVSLNYKQRKKEFNETQNSLLNLENNRRKAKGKKTYASIKEMKDTLKKENEENEKKSQHDNKSEESRAYLTESAEILLDLINYLKGKKQIQSAVNTPIALSL